MTDRLRVTVDDAMQDIKVTASVYREIGKKVMANGIQITIIKLWPPTIDVKIKDS